MNPITKAIIACATVCIALYFLVAEFLGGTENLNESLDVKSLAYTREEESQAKSVERPQRAAPLPEPTEKAPERDQSVQRIDANSVLPRSAAEPEDSGDQTRENGGAEEGNGTVAQESQMSSGEALLKEVLGIDEPPPPVRAVDVSYRLPENCEASGVVLAPVAVQYRFESPTITGASLQELQLLMSEYRRCDGGEFQFAHNPLGKEDATPPLMQRRLDELKYFFLQNRVPKTALRFPDDS
ncbi:hypothetical protein ACUNV4_26125 [Granulosicoccus sp. 3-233]|uniref:hypothetical protein n=1 Tax=Granulosicoccus sp. 3-233 TaxID=3417969 RepID=UPI003D33BF65